MEAPSMSINRWMDEEVVVHIYNGILLGHEKEQNWVICSDVDEPRVCHTEWSKSEERKYHILLHIYGIHKNGTVQSSHSVMSDSMLPHCLQHSRLPVHHQLPEPTRTRVHRISDAIQPSHPLSFPSPPAFKLSQLQGLFQWVSSSHQVAKLLEFQLQHQSFQWIFMTDFL